MTKTLPEYQWRSQELFLITIRNKKISRNRLFLVSSLFHWYNSGNKNVSADGIERQNKKQEELNNGYLEQS